MNRPGGARRRSVCAVAFAAGSLLAACAGPEAEPRNGAPPGVKTEVRPDTPGNDLQFNFDRSDLVESFASPAGGFRVHFTRSGLNAVPAADEDASGVPDFVEEVASVYDEVLAFYTDELGFRAPPDDGAIADNGGDARFDVYLVDFGGSADGHFAVDACTGEVCVGFMTQENDYVGYAYPSTLYANRVLGSHEFFHAVQAGYDSDQGSVIGEGTAVWATEQYDPSLDDFEYFTDGYLQNPDRPIDEPLPGPVDPFSYGSAIFFQFLEEAYGAGTVRSLWERCEDGAGGVEDPEWLDALGVLLEETKQTTFADAFTEFARWNLFTDDFANPAEAYADASGYARVRIDAGSLPHQDDEIRAYHASAQYYGFDPAGRGAIHAVLVAPQDAPDATTEMRVLVATEAGDVRTTVLLDDATAGTQAVDVSGAERVIVVVVNAAPGGESRKPGLCIGTAEEVATCKLALAGTGAGGAGSGGAGGSAGGGGGDGADEPEDDGCGCSAADRPPSRAWLAGFAALAYFARRRRARSTAAPATAR